MGQFIHLGYDKDSLGRKCEVSVHTDDLPDDLYAEYFEAKKDLEKAEILARQGKNNVALLLGMPDIKECTRNYNRVMINIRKHYGY